MDDYIQRLADNYAPEEELVRQYEASQYASHHRWFRVYRRAGIKSVTFRLNGKL